ncbi:hypothetical protein QYE76_051210 [Lolium multiflorum]|uniref:Uncharacterized protein n=1 Tax=Lolium multiflorum TaxID=4521 RepID=A0AAD8ST15_LOLMU|nr:hypothetical protein QYE76_051210 [Lolium multiflorum]
MAEGTPVTYEDLTEELKKKYDEVKAILEADLIGSFQRTRSHGIRWKGFSLKRSMEWTCHPLKNAPGWRQQVQMAIEQGRLKYAMKVDTHPFPAVNMVECTYPGGCQPGFSFNVNMVGPGHHSGGMGDEVEVVHADDSAEISTAGMNVWETSGQEPLSGINLDDCERIDVTKDGVRLVLSTGLTV